MTTAQQTQVIVNTGKCPHCGKQGYVSVPASQWASWHKDGRLSNFRDAFPGLPVGEVEQMISGTHPLCWDAMFCTCGTTLECEVHE